MKNTLVLVMGLVAVGLLTACGGDRSDNGGGGDPFIESVRNVISNNTSESADPASLDSFPAATTAEDSEPEPL